jgi:hypothetical protein
MSCGNCENCSCGNTVITEENTRLTDIVVGMNLDIRNPVPVYDAAGRPLGSAVLEFVSGGLQARLFLDTHKPEAFDLANDSNRCRFGLSANITDGELRNAGIWLTSK